MPEVARNLADYAIMPDKLRAAAGSEQDMADQVHGKLPRRYYLCVLVIVLLAVIPRLLMACRIDVVCPDGMLYIQLAWNLEQGQLAPEHTPYGFNVYTLVLSCLHRTGLDWETGAKIWGVLCGTLVVLPAFGWLRRQFNLPIAVVGCMLYAVHPKMIEWSAEVVRESTFWLLFVSVLYFGWRAVTESRWLFFVATGVLTTLAIHTRFEGWFLLVPLAIWTWGRRTRTGVSPAERRKLAWGVATVAACYPVVLLALIQLHGYKGWPDSFHRLQFVQNWLTSLVAVVDESPGETAPATSDSEQNPPSTTAPPLVPDEVLPPSADLATSPAVVAAPATSASAASEVAPAPPSKPMFSWVLLWIYVRTLMRGLSPVYAVFLVCGLCAYPRLLRRMDMLALLLGAVLTLAGMWIHLWVGQESSSRYPLSIVIACLPLASLGLLELSFRLAHWNARFLGHPRPTPRLGVAIALAIAAIAGGVDAFIASYDGRLAKADLGRYLRSELGENCRILGSHHWSLTAYYAEGQYLRLPEPEANQPQVVRSFMNDCDPDVVLLPLSRFPQIHVGQLLQSQGTSGWIPIKDDALPPSCRGQIVVLLRDRSTARLPMPLR